jgi:hypothetical protein
VGRRVGQCEWDEDELQVGMQVGRLVYLILNLGQYTHEEYCNIVNWGRVTR